MAFEGLGQKGLKPLSLLCVHLLTVFPLNCRVKKKNQACFIIFEEEMQVLRSCAGIYLFVDFKWRDTKVSSHFRAIWLRKKKKKQVKEMDYHIMLS